MHKGDISEEKARVGKSAYPPPHDRHFDGKKAWVLTNQWKLTQFGVNRIELPPGTHTLQLLVGDKDHVPHKPPVVSKKITITVR